MSSRWRAKKKKKKAPSDPRLRVQCSKSVLLLSVERLHAIADGMLVGFDFRVAGGHAPGSAGIRFEPELEPWGACLFLECNLSAC